jgi:hypothetical protein
MKNLLIGAISGNYTVESIKPWIKSSTFEDVKRVLFYYNPTNTEILEYCKEQGVEVVVPNFDLFNQETSTFLANSGLLTPVNSPLLIHHVRFLHWWLYLSELDPLDRVLLTDVNDVIFNKNPFKYLNSFNRECIVASSEAILHSEEQWNLENFWSTFGIVTDLIKDKEIYNAGTISGTAKIVADLCRDIYLLTLYKPRNADQAAYNYLIQTRYKQNTIFTGLDDLWGVHLHVINQKKIPFNLNNINKYAIIHQYDRLGNEIQHYYTIPK